MGISFDWQVVFPTTELEDAVTTLKVMFPKLEARFQLPSGDIVVVGDGDESAEPDVLTDGWSARLDLRVEIDSYIREMWDGPEPLPPEPSGFYDGDNGEEDEADSSSGWDDEDDEEDEDEDEEYYAWESGMRRAQEEEDEDEEDDWYEEEEESEASEEEDEFLDSQTPCANLDTDLRVEVDTSWSRITIGSDFKSIVTMLGGSPNVKEAVQGLASRLDGFLMENGDGGPGLHHPGVQIPHVAFPDSESIDELGTFLVEQTETDSA